MMMQAGGGCCCCSIIGILIILLASLIPRPIPCDDLPAQAFSVWSGSYDVKDSTSWRQLPLICFAANRDDRPVEYLEFNGTFLDYVQHPDNGKLAFYFNASWGFTYADPWVFRPTCTGIDVYQVANVFFCSTAFLQLPHQSAPNGDTKGELMEVTVVDSLPCNRYPIHAASLYVPVLYEENMDLTVTFFTPQNLCNNRAQTVVLQGDNYLRIVTNTSQRQKENLVLEPVVTWNDEVLPSYINTASCSPAVAGQPADIEVYLCTSIVVEFPPAPTSYSNVLQIQNPSPCTTNSIAISDFILPPLLNVC